MFTKKSSEKYLFDISNYEIISNINKGGFGIINLVREKKTGEKYATKTNLIQTGKQNKLFVSREIRILIQIQHPTIIQFRGFSYEDFGGNNNITILMDYMKEGSLAELISKEQKGICPANYDNTKRQLILIGIARGMMILHKNHIIHRDLKPENILLDSDFHPHITDFGLSKFFDPLNSLTQSIDDFGTAPYMAPEVIDGDNFNTKADVYAFGILMYEVITGQRAYYDLFHGKKKMTVFQLKTEVLKGHRPNIDEGSMKKGFQIMIEKCWSKDPKERPTFQELFHKLSLSSDDDILEFEARQEDQVIIDDDDEDDEIDELGISNRVKKFCLSEVDYSELFDYIDDINKEASTFDQQQNEDQRLNKELINKIKEMEEKIESLEEELDKSKENAQKIEEMKSQMIKMNEIIDDQQKEIESLKTELKSAGKKQMNQLSDQIENIEKKIGYTASACISETEPGILNLLKNKEKRYFDPLFIASMSSRDIYKIIDPNTKQLFCTDKNNFTFIEFEFKDRIGINGMQIFTGGHLFPRSFDIEIDGKIITSIKDASELNKKHACMTINFDPISAKKVRFIQTDLSWDSKYKGFSIKRIEFLSYEEKYSKGVFSTFIEENENHDPHKCPVHITSSFSDFNSFFMVDSKKQIASGGLKDQWFQIELLHGSAILTGFRIKSGTNTLKSFKIICTDDENKPIEEWTTLLVVDDKPKEEHAQIQTYEFKEQSPNTKFVRLIKTGPDWNNKLYLSFYHFDLFGWYF